METISKWKRMIGLQEMLLVEMISYKKICQVTLNFCFSRSSRQEVFCRKDFLRHFAKFTGKHMCQSLCFNKVADLRPATLLKKRLWHRCFPVHFAKFLRTPLFNIISGSCFCFSYSFRNLSHWKCQFCRYDSTLLSLLGGLLRLFILTAVRNWFNSAIRCLIIYQKCWLN